ncbi:unnamed protein product [Rangifer tarandus platyrhynchus]|uniref:Uncharacterized protein n=1 Tax=Rangifer tarandus platyrhynchus TaxID=3082113 RepID=A0ABN8YUK7_RANTA|nr:unnamed protein product [Rangifer tarandus platyrhynchus]
MRRCLTSLVIREMQIKNKLVIKVAKIFKNCSKCWCDWSNWNCHMWLVGMYRDTATLENSLAMCYIVKHNICHLAVLLLGLLMAIQRVLCSCSQRYSDDWIQTDEWINTVYLYYGIHHSPKIHHIPFLKG